MLFGNCTMMKEVYLSEEYRQIHMRRPIDVPLYLVARILKARLTVTSRGTNELSDIGFPQAQAILVLLFSSTNPFSGLAALSLDVEDY